MFFCFSVLTFSADFQSFEFENMFSRLRNLEFSFKKNNQLNISAKEMMKFSYISWKEFFKFSERIGGLQQR